MKVKIMKSCTGYLESFENEINEFIEDKNVKDIKFKVCKDDWQEFYYVIIMYE